jgi:predicted SnoaL-like aldol condensation-catalyzing enzyme
MSNEENFDLIRRFNQVLAADDELTTLDDLVAPDFVAHGGTQEVRGREGWRQFVLDTRKEWGEIETGIDELIGDGNLVAERWWMRGGGEGDAAMSAHGITIHRIVNGRIQEDWAVYDPDQ